MSVNDDNDSNMWYHKQDELREQRRADEQYEKARTEGERNYNLNMQRIMNEAGVTPPGLGNLRPPTGGTDLHQPSIARGLLSLIFGLAKIVLIIVAVWLVGHWIFFGFSTI